MPRVEILGNMPVWLLQMNPSESMVDMYIVLVVALCSTWVGTCIASSAATVRLSSSCVFFGRPRLDVLWVERTPFCVCFMCPISVAYSMPMYFWMSFALRPGHPRRYPALAAAISDLFG